MTSGEGNIFKYNGEEELEHLQMLIQTLVCISINPRSVSLGPSPKPHVWGRAQSTGTDHRVHWGFLLLWEARPFPSCCTLSTMSAWGWWRASHTFLAQPFSVVALKYLIYSFHRRGSSVFVLWRLLEQIQSSEGCPGQWWVRRGDTTLTMHSVSEICLIWTTLEW